MPDSSSARTRRRQADSERLTWPASCTLLMRPSFCRALRINLSCLSNVMKESCVKPINIDGNCRYLPILAPDTQASVVFESVSWLFGWNDFRSGESHEDRCTQRD